ncbi:single-stranded-DNA-specific exonuclease RecJ [Selenomonadales bacterium OttesenSCG-928-I06]|nr:single-stranded-DNA-specific exonuclease RecJ [Selenomonadales bacterium OttesenSCG-928-I06]
MEIIKKSWNFLPEIESEDLLSELCLKLNISQTIARILINRGITNVDLANDFLYSSKDNLYNPLLLKDINKAIERIDSAILKGEKILIYGDYDVDGITSCAILHKTLKMLGANFECYIPDRKTEGYGLTITALENIKLADIDLLITVDCGITSNEEIDWLNSLDNPPDVIITDHHEVLSVVPDAYAIINPKQKDCLYPDKNLAGVGVAFKLAQALLEKVDISSLEQDKINSLIAENLEMVALGTIADIVSLTNENRVLVKLGIENLKKTNNLGIQALGNIASLDLNKIDTTSVGFIIGPRLNAAGRMSHASKALSLLLSEDMNEATELALELNRLNKTRQDIEGNILSEAQEQIRKFDLDKEKIIFLVGENWHLGVIGIVASKLIDKYFRPVIIVTKENGVGKGSCRSIKSFNIFKALEECGDIFVDFGGHHQAAGFTINIEDIELFREKINLIANKALSVSDYIPEITIDARTSLDDISFDFLEELALLAPFGQDNPSPVFAIENVRISDLRNLGQNKQHLKITPYKKNFSVPIEILGWNYSDISASLLPGTYIDIIFYPKYNEWQGNKNIQLILQDICFKFFANIKVSVNKDYNSLTKNDVSRDIIGKIYVFLKNTFLNKNISFKIDLNTIFKELNSSGNTIKNPQAIDVALRVLKELDLIAYKQEKDYYHFFMVSNPASKKELVDSPTYNIHCI